MKKLIKIGVGIISAALLLTSCTEPEPPAPPKQKKLELKPSKTSIKTGGEDIITFTVMADDEDVTSLSIIKNVTTDETYAEGANTFSSVVDGEFEFTATCFGRTTEPIKIIASTTMPELAVDKNSITGNNIDKAVFTVTYEGKDVTAEAKIKNAANNEELDSNEFSTIKAGEYSFVGEYMGLQTEAVKVTVVGTGISFSASRDAINSSGNDKVAFTVIYDMEDVTRFAKIKNKTANAYLPDGTFEFSSTTVGNVEFQAEYSGKTSETITINVTASGLVVTADKNLILNDGIDKAVLSASDNSTNVSTGVEFFNVTLNKPIEGNEFKTTFLRKHKIVAKYNNKVSDPIIISSKPTKEFYRYAALLKFTGTWCGYCAILGKTLAEVETAYPDRLETINVHSGDQMESAQIALLAKDGGLGDGIPFVAFDFVDKFEGAHAYATMLTALKKRVEDYPADCGISIESTMSNNTVHATVKLWSKEAKQYRLGVMLVEDGLKYSQASGGKDYIHNSTFRYFVNNEDGLFGETIPVTEANGELVLNYSFKFYDPAYISSRGVKKEFVAENSRLLVYLTVPEGSTHRVANIATCPVNGFTDYKFEQ